MKYTFVHLIILSLLVACSSTKKQAELLEQTKPEWLKERPVSSHYFYGIGITPKVGSAMFYEEKAKERALSDLSKQISTKIKSEQNMYRMEDNKGVYEYIQSRIKASSEEFLEGYEYVDKWEDLNNYYAFYKLSKSEFYALKAKRKEDAMQLSLLKLQQAKEAESQMQAISSLEQYASAIDAISSYLNEETSIETPSGKLDLFEESKEGIHRIISLITLQYSNIEATATANSKVNAGLSQLDVNFNNHKAYNIPVIFNYSGGFLVTDKFKSDVNGIIASPEFTYTNNAKETLTARLDLKSLSRQISRNLLVRQLITNQKPVSTTLTITVD